MTGKEIVDRWWPHRNPDGCRGDLINVINASIDAALAAERERCAKIAERYEPDQREPYVNYPSQEIRDLEVT
jgi:hypothetical protein